jgi:prepilin-type N-terminal cleavage/methylation domain-containing protein
MAISRNGFSLLELLLVLAVSLTLVAVIGEALLGELGESGRLARSLRERTVIQRALELMRMELQEATGVRVLPGVITREGCGLTGRTVLLHLDFTPDGVVPDRDVTYSLERKPDPIWRGQALMRCGPAYGLNGQMEDSGAVSRVWLDAIDVNGMDIKFQEKQILKIELKRLFQGSTKELSRQEAIMVIGLTLTGLEAGQQSGLSVLPKRLRQEPVSAQALYCINQVLCG